MKFGGERAKASDKTEETASAPKTSGKAGKNAAGAHAAKAPNWFARSAQAHRHAFADAAARLRRHFLSSLLTVAAIGITLALPAGMESLIRGVSAIGYNWESALQASLFLKDSVSPERGAALAREIAAKPGISASVYISREQGLAEFRQRSGYGAALDLLQDNPLPAAIVVTPDRRSTREQASTVMAALSKLPEVDRAQLDQEWLDRLFAIFGFARQVVAAVAALFALAVIVVIANTIRLDVEARREEILVMKLVGATDSYIRRPFLYSGMLYGIFGALVACALVSIGLSLMVRPALAMFDVEQVPAALLDLSPETAGIIFAVAVGLGLLASWFAVTRRLAEIQPAG